MNSIWRRDLAKTRWGFLIYRRVLPALLLGEGVMTLMRQTFTFRGFIYEGFSADCIAIGLISLALTLIAVERGNAKLLLFLWIITAAAFLTFLFRNV